MKDSHLLVKLLKQTDNSEENPSQGKQNTLFIFDN